MPNPGAEFASGFTRGLANALNQKRKDATERDERQRQMSQQALQAIIPFASDPRDIFESPMFAHAFGLDQQTGKKGGGKKGQPDPMSILQSVLGPALQGNGAPPSATGSAPSDHPLAMPTPVPAGGPGAPPALAASGHPALVSPSAVPPSAPTTPTGRSVLGFNMLSPLEIKEREVDTESSLFNRRVNALMTNNPEMSRMEAVQIVSNHNLPVSRPAAGSGGFSLGPDQVRFDENGKEIARGVSKADTDKPPTLGSFEDYLANRYAPEHKKDPKALTTADIEDARKRYNQSDDRAGANDTAARRAETKDQMAKLVDVVIANPAAFDNLTPTIQAQIIPDLAAKGFTGFGKTLNESAVKQIAETKSALGSLNDLKDTLRQYEAYIGPLAGLQAINPYSEGRKAQAAINLVKQRVGKALEGGVLRKEDEEKYKQILATLTDEPSTAIFKVDNLVSTLERDLQNYVNEQRLAGRRVGEAPKSDSAERIAARKYLLDNGLPTSDANIDFYLKNAKK